jgi:hypothetical protein
LTIYLNEINIFLLTKRSEAMSELSVSTNIRQYGTHPKLLGEALSAVAEAQQLRRALEHLGAADTLSHYGAHSTPQLGQALSAAAEAQRLRDECVTAADVCGR